MEQSVHKITISSKPDKTYFLKMNWKEKLENGFTIVLCDGMSAWQGQVYKDLIFQEVRDMEMKMEQYIQELTEALTTDLKQSGKYSFDLSCNMEDESMIVFSYEKVLKDVSFKLGSVELHQVTEPLDVIKELINYGLDHCTELKARNAHLLRENKRLEEELEYIAKEMEKYVQVKETLEQDLYTRFVLVLNEKKSKIRNLQQKLKQVQDNSDGTTTFQKEIVPEDDYEGSTDEENTENNDCSQPTTSARGKHGCDPHDESLPDVPDIAPSRKRRQRHCRGDGSEPKRESSKPQEKGWVATTDKKSNSKKAAAENSAANKIPQEPEDLFEEI
ncbi:DNA repair protein XRCC4 isoform X2 [Polypterus senegalus]|nr:DNA repair protein XRCC4 isoform X2 [Polypterus senegalus]